MFRFFGCKTCGILTPPSGVKPAAPALEGEILATGLPGKSLSEDLNQDSVVSPFTRNSVDKGIVLLARYRDPALFVIWSLNLLLLPFCLWHCSSCSFSICHLGFAFLFGSFPQPLSTKLPPPTFRLCLSSCLGFHCPPQGHRPRCHLSSPGPAVFRPPNPFTLFPSQVANKWPYFPRNTHRCLLRRLKILDIDDLKWLWLLQASSKSFNPSSRGGKGSLTRSPRRTLPWRHTDCSPV